MNEKLMKYVDGIFSPYEDNREVRELKEELYTNLQEKWQDYINQGYDKETAYRITVNSIGNVGEMIESISRNTKEQNEMVRKDFSTLNLQKSDFNGVTVHDAKFHYSALKGSDFSGSDLTDSSFKSSDLKNVKFDGANLTRVEFITSDIKNTSFKSCILDSTDFNGSDLSGICFDNLTLNNTIFNKTELSGVTFKNTVLRNVHFKNANVKKAIFEGATMDKLTYAVLKGYKADLTNVIVI